MSDTVVGIDLGTTNSEIAAFRGDRIAILAPHGDKMLPSCVGLSPAGELLVGTPARNQQLLYPERTVRSIKRKMGSDEMVKIGEQEFSPQEISSLILRELVGWASEVLDEPIERAVITVPAYFSDAQRQATREAGELAGLQVERVLNEPTAASLAYGRGQEQETVLVYDLGGGTFDVSIVRLDGDVTEVLASAGDNRLGGDDFNKLLVERLTEQFDQEHGLDLRRDHPVAFSRIWWAVEEAKRALSAGPYARIREENLVVEGGRSLHLDVEVSRDEYESLIGPLVNSTMESVTRALDGASVLARQLDAILLVGGSTRTPLVQQMLTERSGSAPRQDVHPDLCVALGAGVLASRIGGREVDRVLVDITPYSFGIAYLGTRGGVPYPHCYKPIIVRNTSLPVTRTERYFTSTPYQKGAEIDVYQGDNADSLCNIPVGRFLIQGLETREDASEILCRMKLDLDGILHVSATEKDTGKVKQVTFDGALTPKSPEEITEARQRMEQLYESLAPGPFPDRQADPQIIDEDGDVILLADEGAKVEIADEGPSASEQPDGDPIWIAASKEAEALLQRSLALLERMHTDDREDAIDLHEQIHDALKGRDGAALKVHCDELRELLYFIEGH
jgi:molecular chaperone DnaK